MSENVIKVPEFAPGCYGSALAFSKTDMVCGACPFSSKCEPEHQRAKTILKARFGIGFKEKPVKKVEAVPEPVPAELTPDEKTEELLRWIEAMKVGVHDHLKAKMNPFGDRTKFMQVICGMLLRRPVVNDAMLVTSLTHVLKCSEDTARNYIRIGIKALTHLGAITNQNGVYAVRRD